MSSITFHSPSGSASLRGSERAHMGCLASDIFQASIQPLLHNDATRNALIMAYPQGHYLRTSDFVPSNHDILLPLGHCDPDLSLADPDGVRHSVFIMQLNTMLAVGNEPLQLLARIHGQCEIHGWIDGADRAYFANIITGGLSSGLLREDQGWEELRTFLRESKREPVVMSYSVTDSFPTPTLVRPKELAEDTAEAFDENFYGLSVAQQWKACMAALQSIHGLQIQTPERMRIPYYFGDGLNGFQYTARMFKAAKEKK